MEPSTDTEADERVAMRRRILVIGTVLALVTFGCGDDDSSDASSAEGEEEEHEEAELAFGEPADASEATRTIEVLASDSMVFEPDAIDVDVGETVTFEIVNEGAIAHDFTLGDEDTQAEHEAEMREMEESGEMMHSEANAVVVEAGETGELTWHFTEPGEVIFGCHQIGHYDAGMYGTITIAA